MSTSSTVWAVPKAMKCQSPNSDQGWGALDQRHWSVTVLLGLSPSERKGLTRMRAITHTVKSYACVHATYTGTVERGHVCTRHIAVPRSSHDPDTERSLCWLKRVEPVPCGLWRD